MPPLLPLRRQHNISDVGHVAQPHTFTGRGVGVERRGAPPALELGLVRGVGLGRYGGEEEMGWMVAGRRRVVVCGEGRRVEGGLVGVC